MNGFAAKTFALKFILIFFYEKAQQPDYSRYQQQPANIFAATHQQPGPAVQQQPSPISAQDLVNYFQRLRSQQQLVRKN